MPRGRVDMPLGPGRPRGSPNKAPAGLAAYVRELTLQSHEIVNFYLAVLRADTKVLMKPPRLREQMQAADWLANRGFGRPAQVVEADETLASVLKAALLKATGKFSD